MTHRPDLTPSFVGRAILAIVAIVGCTLLGGTTAVAVAAPQQAESS